MKQTLRINGWAVALAPMAVVILLQIRITGQITVRLVRGLYAVETTTPGTTAFTDVLSERWFAPAPALVAPTSLLLVGRASEEWTQFLEHWKGVLSSNPSALRDSRVLVASVSPSREENDFQSALRSLVHVETVRIRDPERFRYGTGISSVPAAILVAGAERRVIVTIIGVIPPEQFSERFFQRLAKQTGPALSLRVTALTLIDESSIQPFEPQ